MTGFRMELLIHMLLVSDGTGDKHAAGLVSDSTVDKRAAGLKL